MVLQFAGVNHEQLLVLFYDNSLGFRGQVVLHEGDINSVGFSMRKVCDAALQHNASYMIMAHNHPHGLPIASSDDLNTTSRVNDFMSQMSVILIDHFIIGEGRFSSVQKEVYYSVAELIKEKIEITESRSED